MFSNKFNSKGVRNAKKRLDAAHNAVGKKVAALGLKEEDVKTINNILSNNHSEKYLDLMNRAAKGELTEAETADLSNEEAPDEEPTPAPVSNPTSVANNDDLSFLGPDKGETAKAAPAKSTQKPGGKKK